MRLYKGSIKLKVLYRFCTGSIAVLSRIYKGYIGVL